MYSLLQENIAFYFQFLYWSGLRVTHFGPPLLKLASFCGCQSVTFLLWDLLGHRCYLCDDEVQYCNSNRLGQVVDYVRKQAGNTTPESGAEDNGNIELENKKLEKESKNEQEREKKENMARENPSMNSTSQITVKGLSNLGNTCFFNAVMQVPMLIFLLFKKILVFSSLR